ncbi:oxygen-independent coproporphyrinogen III oxidase [Coriobacterium glomerans PW2]|uniref:Heme chaperone HemW n=1 Tax=Coriobacterium glomerans (strain ATCC 49209 / DSM 20642 / JCM 10262 / PW2) TaxID=700015 RepID=F2N7P9_CORGP|nr:coproporphyrinogen-III oxidase family protein [Coriobacterium glomerans]AEB06941.1 oxygen-independent coproporphyrinogen III oxidase [Coriobacterium glomerans PW2]
MGVHALYVHMPFCRSRCPYCDFFSCALGARGSDAQAGAYLDMVCARIDELGSIGVLDHLRCGYIGGGTPSLFGPALAGAVARIRRWCEPVEITCEANPESCTASFCSAIARAGATRISLGVQSLIDEELAVMGRIHTRERALCAIEIARATGMSVSCDLMCGLPGQTADSWERTLLDVIEAAPDHISVYPLSIEPGTPFERRCARDAHLVPDEDLQADLMIAARAMLREAGFEPYEVASYARSGHACLHNIAYWTAKSYAAIGPSAAAMFSVDEFTRYREAFPGVEPGPRAARVRLRQRDARGRSFEAEFLDERETVAEDLMLGMRMSAGIGAGLLDRARTTLGDAALTRALESALEGGLASWSRVGRDERLVPTERGWLFGNELYGLMWDLAADG